MKNSMKSQLVLSAYLIQRLSVTQLTRHWFLRAKAVKLEDFPRITGGKTDRRVFTDRQIIRESFV